jgi:hypothetical protein
MKPARFVRANRFWRFILDRLNGAAITMPWRTVYVYPGHDSPTLRAHEQVHLDQIERYGPVRWSVLYLWFLARHGYERNPFEVEAYRNEGQG